MNELTNEITQKYIIQIIDSFFEKTKEEIKGWNQKRKIDLRNAFYEYLRASEKNNSKIKTLLYRNTPKDLYSFYECIGIKYNNKKIDTASINNLLKINKKIIITGTGGIGKSIMLKHLFLNSIQETSYIPVFLELRNIDNLGAKEFLLSDYLYEHLLNLKIKLDKKYFEYSLEKGCYIFLFDGYDEVKSTDANKMMQEILKLTNKYQNNVYIVSSRPMIEFTGWNNFIEAKALTLTKRQALSLIKKLDYEKKVKENFYKETKDTLFGKYEEFMSNPLLLTIMLMTFDNRASIPDRLNDFYEQAFSVLFHTHDSSKGAYKRDIMSKLGYEDFKMIFSYVCFISYFNDKFSFNEREILEYIDRAKTKKIIDKSFSNYDFFEDLKKSVCMLIREGNDYKFIHRSFQEYFAALYTMQLSDKIQNKLIVKYYQQSFHLNNNYIKMLYFLQSDRFVKNFIFPELNKVIKRLKLKGSKNSLEWEFLKIICSSVSFEKEKHDTDKGYQGWYQIKNPYYHSLFSLVRNLILEKEKVAKNKDELVKKILLICKENERISLEEFEKNECYLEFLPIFSYMLNSIKKMIEYIEKLENQKKIQKSTLKDILEEI